MEFDFYSTSAKPTRDLLRLANINNNNNNNNNKNNKINCFIVFEHDTDFHAAINLRKAVFPLNTSVDWAHQSRSDSS